MDDVVAKGSSSTKAPAMLVTNGNESGHETGRRSMVVKWNKRQEDPSLVKMCDR
jgi:hypothetical protein